MLKRISTSVAYTSVLGSIISVVATKLITRQSVKINGEMDRAIVTSAGEPLPYVSVLVPARNEEKNIRACLESILGQDYSNFEVIAINDHSTDRTPEILDELKAKYPGKLRILNIEKPLPAGWTGKNNALWNGYAVVDGRAEWLLFVDSDTQLRSGALRGGIVYSIANKLDMLSLNPDYFASFWHKFLLPELGKIFSIASYDYKPNSPDSAAANGAFIMVKRSSYDAVGGHETVREFIIEDTQMARTFKRAGFNLTLNSASSYILQTPEPGFKFFWESVSKTWFIVARGNWVKLFVVVLLQLCNIVPFITVVFNIFQPKGKRLAWKTNIYAVAVMIAVYAEMLQVFKTPRPWALFYPFVAVVDMLLVINSAVRIGLLRSVKWRDRPVIDPLAGFKDPRHR